MFVYVQVVHNPRFLNDTMNGIFSTWNHGEEKLIYLMEKLENFVFNLRFIFEVGKKRYQVPRF